MPVPGPDAHVSSPERPGVLANGREQSASAPVGRDGRACEVEGDKSVGQAAQSSAFKSSAMLDEGQCIGRIPVEADAVEAL
eukprot:2981416-Rhodomonas_salina.4